MKTPSGPDKKKPGAESPIGTILTDAYVAYKGVPYIQGMAGETRQTSLGNSRSVSGIVSIYPTTPLIGLQANFGVVQYSIDLADHTVGDRAISASSVKVYIQLVAAMDFLMAAQRAATSEEPASLREIRHV